jgi:hypothetical protein
MYIKQAIIESNELKLSLNDPIVAETQCFEMLKKFKESTKTDKRKIKLALLKAMKKSQALNQTFIASHYRQTLGRMEQ